LSGRSKVSSIFRSLRNRIEWLREVTQHPAAGVVSRAHLPRLLARVAPLKGSKASEIPVVRDLLTRSQLETHKVTLDAHHCNPTTTAHIHQAGGQYVIQVKDNQPLLLKQCQHGAATAVPLGSHAECEKGHGRLTTREGQCFGMHALDVAPRWSDSGVHTLVVMKRHTLTLATQQTTCETAYSISNQALNTDPHAQAMALTGAIRQHWHVESDNWIRDVTLEEDHIKTPSANQAQIMGCLCSVALRVLRRFNVKNFQEALEDFADCPSRFEALLRRVKFL
jgi:predicted transposase YbfD/YdcC